MNPVLIWFNGLILALAVAGGWLFLYARASQRARLLARAVTEVQRRNVAVARIEAPVAVSRGVLAGLRRLGALVPLMNAAQRTEAASRLIAAGYRAPQALLVLTGVTVLCVVLLIGGVIAFGGPYLDAYGAGGWALALLVAGYIGTLLPRLVLDRVVARRQAAIRLSLPDALDLMVICTNAGLALNAALERTADELEVVAPELADEFKLTATELRLSSDVETVLGGLAARTKIDGMRSLVSTLLQARQYGTAITQALRVLAKGERTARMMRLEEKAAKLAVRMTIPMMLFILPTVIIVGAGPAIMSIGKALRNFGSF